MSRGPGAKQLAILDALAREAGHDLHFTIDDVGRTSAAEASDSWLRGLVGCQTANDHLAYSRAMAGLTARGLVATREVRGRRWGWFMLRRLTPHGLAYLHSRGRNGADYAVTAEALHARENELEAARVAAHARAQEEQGRLCEVMKAMVLDEGRRLVRLVDALDAHDLEGLIAYAHHRLDALRTAQETDE